ncbi:MAG: glycosyltransferase family 9 protein [Deltaproteobacteria bacterium]|nr:glycosyltransferase family 9 protein [Deltaproteobacteria bacterium]
MKETKTAKLLKGTPLLPTENGPILVIQLGDIGDAVLTLPAIEALGKAFPKRSLVLCVREHAGELMEDCPWVHHVLSVNKERRKLRAELFHQVQFFKALRKYRCALAIELRTGTRGAVIAFLSGARTRVARYANDGILWRNRLFTHLVKPGQENIQYAAQHNLNIMAPFGLFSENPRPTISVPERRRKKAQTLFLKNRIPKDRPLMAVHPFSLWRYKEWSLSEMAALLDRIQAEYRCAVVVTGAPNERKRAEDLIGICSRKPYNLAGETSIGELPAVFEACRLFIGVDTAALHIAAAVGIPTVGIFGPSSWTNWAPRGHEHLVVKKGLSCQPCSQKGCNGSERSRCLMELTADEVYKGMEGMLDRTFAGKREVC